MKNVKFYGVLAISILLFSFGKDLSTPAKTDKEVNVTRGELVTKLRVLTHNVYGLPGSECDDRGRTFGRRVARAVPKYDIVGVQEYYKSPIGAGACDSKHLSNAIWSTGLYKEHYHRFYPAVRWQVNGGVGVFSLHEIRQFKNWQWNNDEHPAWKAAEGFVFARVKIPSAVIRVDVYIVHLNSGGGNRDRRKKQLQQLAARIKEYSAGSGNPVIVMGDFNIGGPPSYNGNAGYQDIMRILKSPVDLWYSVNKDKNGFTADAKNNTVSKANGDKGQERIDYIFAITDREFTNSPYTVSVAGGNDIKVVDWKVPRRIDARKSVSRRQDRAAFNISDHYGLEATIEIRKK